MRLQQSRIVTSTVPQTINPTATPSAISDLSSWDLAACSVVIFILDSVDVICTR